MSSLGWLLPRGLAGVLLLLVCDLRATKRSVCCWVQLHIAALLLCWCRTGGPRVAASLCVCSGRRQERGQPTTTSTSTTTTTTDSYTRARTKTYKHTHTHKHRGQQPTTTCSWPERWLALHTASKRTFSSLLLLLCVFMPLCTLLANFLLSIYFCWCLSSSSSFNSKASYIGAVKMFTGKD